VRFELVIFDCDGVLVDSEPIANRVLAECLSDAGLPMTAEQSYRRFRGMSYAACFADAEAELGRPLPASFVQDHWGRLEAALLVELEPVPFVHEALARIATPSCVASNGRLSTMHKTLAKAGLSARFEGRIFSADDVARPKPAPDLFLYAAARLGADPVRCAVVEDTPHGVTAGVAAGMTVFGYAAQSDAAQLAASGARVFADMRALPELLEATSGVRRGR
jgi:HAD superfamily hydrolase (TIGR01509 family)